MNKIFIEQIKNTIIHNHLLDNGDSVLIAVSGGADSVCLLDVLYTLKDEFSLSLYAAHLNHMLRDNEADRDEDFVIRLCENYKIPLYCEHVDVAALSKKNNITCEEAGRKARYDFFLRLKTKYSVNKIATAHNKNDNVETVCMRFLRGTGIDGLSGIPVANNFSVIRPLLNTSRTEIESYLKKKGISYVTDSSNLSDDYTRNRIRHHFLPNIVENYNKNFVETLNENIMFYREAGQYLKKQVSTTYSKLASRHSYGICFEISALLHEENYMMKAVIQKAVFDLIKKNIPAKTIRLIFQEIVFGNGSAFMVSPELSVQKKYDKLFLVKKSCVPQFQYSSCCLDEINISETGAKICFTEGNDIKFPLKGKNTFFMARSACDGKAFTVRNRRQGDCISLSYGHKSLKKLMIEKKIPSFLRDEIPILLLDDEIVWVCGICENPFYRAKCGEKYIKISYCKETNHE